MLNGISAITKGQSHINDGTECQDCTDLEINGDKYALATVADGHGSKKHFRSDRGSQFAVEAAKESIFEYMDNYEKFTQAYETNKEYLIDRIIKMVITKWHQKIQNDMDINPITEEEINKYLGGNFNKDKKASIYGTTLLVGVMSKNCNFGFLIGDGSFVVIDKNGKAYIPIEDLNSKANYTSSLSSSDSFNGFVKYFFDEKPFSIMVSTDGLVKSFANDNDFLDYNQAIAMELGGLDDIEKKDQMEERLTKLFEQRTREGSEDDISISIIFDSDEYEGVRKGLETRRKINKIDEQIDASKKRLITLDFKENQIINERTANIENLNKIKQEISDWKLYNQKLLQRKKMLEEELLKLEKEQDRQKEKKLKLDLEFEKYEEIDKIKKQEQNKNLEDKNLEEASIKYKQLEKKKLQDSINS